MKRTSSVSAEAAKKRSGGAPRASEQRRSTSKREPFENIEQFRSSKTEGPAEPTLGELMRLLVKLDRTGVISEARLYDGLDKAIKAEEPSRPIAECGAMSSNSKSAEIRPLLSQATERLHTSLSHAETTLEKLADRLCGVLRPPGPQPACGVAEAPLLPPAVDAIHCAGSRVENLISRLSDLLERLEA